MTQPWASLVAIGENTIETRSWSTRYRGPLAIHAAKAFPPDARALCDEHPYRDVLAAAGYADWSSLPTGAVIAVAELTAVMAFERSTLADVRARSRRGLLPRHEAEFGDFSPGRYGFVLTVVRALRTPVPARGMLGLWTVPRALERKLGSQLS